MKQRVVVGISGGVDSSVAALLLVQAGYEVHGVFMKNWEDSASDEPGYCADDDLADAEDVCETLGIPLHKVNFVAEYRDRVFRHFLDEYRRGRTPNPDILCNKEIKFKAFLDHARQLGAELIATGHYARRKTTGDGHRLLKGVDPNKDQSYFLHALNQQQLASALFPLGELQKSDVRGLAEINDLVTFDKKDSTGVCFIGERDFRAFLNHYIPAQPGPMRTPQGEQVGEHMGLMFYTLGQRRGLQLGGRAGGDNTGQPWFVVAKDMSNNTLIVARGERPLLYSDSLTASAVHWIAGREPPLPLRCCAKTRYRQADQDCTVSIVNDTLNVHFDQPQRAVTPGQSVVFYQADRCLGGAVIERVA